MRSRRLRIISIMVFAVGFVLVAILSLASLQSKRAVRITVRSEPSGATVFDEKGQIGIAPVVVELQPGERRFLRLIKKGCADADAAIVADALLPRTMVGRIRRRFQEEVHEVRVTMRPVMSASLTVTSAPAGAEVVLNGKSEGLTPFSRQNIAPGKHVLRLVHPDCFAVEKTLDVVPGESLKVHQALDSKVVAVYRELIEKEPGLLTHHAELAHYYVLNGQFAEASDALLAGYEAAKVPGASARDRFFAEVLRIYIRQYEYPSEPEGGAVRPTCMAIMKKADEEGTWQAKQVKRYLKQMNAYENKHHRR